MATGMASVPGGELYYQLRGAGRPIVLLHAGFMDHRMWDEQFELLAGDFTTIRYDARGHGRSSAPVGDFSNFQDLHDLLAGLGVPRATLVGLSLGARTAVDFALTHPHMVEGLALAAPGVSGMRQTDPVLLEYAKAMAAAEKAGDAGMLVEWFLRSWVDGPGRTPAQVDQAMRARCQAMAAGTVAKLTRDRGRVLEVGAIGRLDELRAPTLVMVGDLDSSDIHQVADLLAAQVPGAAKVAVGGAGHMLNLERRDVFDRALLAFLDSAGTA